MDAVHRMQPENESSINMKWTRGYIRPESNLKFSVEETIIYKTE